MESWTVGSTLIQTQFETNGANTIQYFPWTRPKHFDRNLRPYRRLISVVQKWFVFQIDCQMASASAIGESKAIAMSLQRQKRLKILGKI